MKYRLLRSSCPLVAAVVSAGQSANAFGAAVTWQAAFEIQTAADIHLASQQVVYAVNGGDNVGNPAEIPFGTTYPSTQNVIIGGRTIAFEGLSVKYGSESTFASNSYGDVKDHLYGQSNNVAFQATSERGTALPLSNWDYADSTAAGYARDYAPSTGNTDLDSILNSTIWSDARTANSTGSALNIFLNNLVPGTVYQVQLIGPADSRPTDSGKIDNSLNVDYVTDQQGDIGTNLGAYMDLNGDGSSHVTSLVGTFTADSTGYQELSVLLQSGRNPGISAIILSTAAVPEPASLAVITAGACSLLARRRR